MLSKNEAERLACMANALRPDWPSNSLMTLLLKHRNRTYRDAAVALAWIATDPDTKTPARLNESGPWWKAVAAGDGSVRRGDHTMRCPEHGGRLPCEPCKDGVTGPPEDVRAEMRAALEEAKTTHHQRDAAQAEREARKP